MAPDCLFSLFIFSATLQRDQENLKSKSIAHYKTIVVAFKAIPDVEPGHFCLQVVVIKATFFPSTDVMKM